MKNYDEYLNKCIERALDKQITSSKSVLHEVGKILRETCANKKYAIWGSGDHTIQLHKYFSLEMKDAEFIIDNDRSKDGKKFLEFDIKYPSIDILKELDVIFISSFSCAEAIEKQIEGMNIDVVAINIYKKLAEKGINLKSAFYSDTSVYIELYNHKKLYEQTHDEKLLEEIILKYLEIRDMTNAKIYMKLYIDNNYSKREKVLVLLNEIEKLEDSIKEEINNRKENNIFLFYWDALRYKDIFSQNTPMKYIKEKLNNSTYFTNLYSPSITTYESVPSILTGKDPKDDDIKDGITVDEEQCEFIKNAQQQGYKIKIYSNHWNIIDGKNIEYFDGNYATLTIWNAIYDMIKNEYDKNLYILYFWQETHPPHLCGSHTHLPVAHLAPFSGNKSEAQTQEAYTAQYIECLKYVDDVTKYYYNILGDKLLKILFSDHGQVVEEATFNLNEINSLAGWHDDRIHVPLIFTGGNIHTKKITGLNTLMNFNKMMNQVLDGQQIELKEENYVFFRFSKMENSIIIKKYLEAGLDDYLYGFTGYINDVYKYIVTGNCKTRCYLKNTDEEIIDEKKVGKIKQEFVKKSKLKRTYSR